jgi:UDP-N-acetylmuramoyl-tripeptide--D-alanyl-D-alanine ligase
VQTMLQALKATPGAARRIAILGEMLELGDSAFALHEACGRAAADSHVDVLVAVGGPAADGLIAGARARGLKDVQLVRFSDSASASGPVAALIQAGDLVLIKGSRGTRMDVIADALVAAERQG